MLERQPIRVQQREVGRGRLCKQKESRESHVRDGNAQDITALPPPPAGSFYGGKTDSNLSLALRANTGAAGPIGCFYFEVVR